MKKNEKSLVVFTHPADQDGCGFNIEKSKEHNAVTRGNSRD